MDAIVRECAIILQLLASKAEMQLIRRNARLVLEVHLGVQDGVLSEDPGVSQCVCV